MRTTIALWIISLMLSLGCAGCKKVDVAESKRDGEKILLKIKKLIEETEDVPEEADVIAAGISLNEWRYTKTSENSFMLWKYIGFGNNYLKYRSDDEGEFGRGWSTEYENRNSERVP